MMTEVYEDKRGRIRLIRNTKYSSTSAIRALQKRANKMKLRRRRAVDNYPSGPRICRFLAANEYIRADEIDKFCLLLSKDLADLAIPGYIKNADARGVLIILDDPELYRRGEIMIHFVARRLKKLISFRMSLHGLPEVYAEFLAEVRRNINFRVRYGYA